jgi:hypothetical protein
MSAHQHLRIYCTDLSKRVALRDQWRLRHPDWDTQLFRREHLYWLRADDDDAAIMKFESSFDPTDLEPNTADVLTVDTFLALMQVALQADERSAFVWSLVQHDE